MAAEKSLKILSDAEITDLYSAPVINPNAAAPHIADVFEFDNTNVCSCCRGTSDQNCSLSTEIWAVKPDLRFVSNSVLPGQELLPFNLSQQNQQHYFERVDYYGAKLNRNSPAGEAASVSDATGTSLSGLAESGSEH